jgi:hypothetical protein
MKLNSLTMMKTGQVNRKEQLYALLNMQMGPVLKNLNVWFFINEQISFFLQTVFIISLYKNNKLHKLVQ